MSKSYFDKFIDDQIKRSEQIKKTRQERQVAPEHDLKRKQVNSYRERIQNLLRIKRKK